MAKIVFTAQTRRAQPDTERYFFAFFSASSIFLMNFLGSFSKSLVLIVHPVLGQECLFLHPRQVAFALLGRLAAADFEEMAHSMFFRHCTRSCAAIKCGYNAVNIDDYDATTGSRPLFHGRPV